MKKPLVIILLMMSGLPITGWVYSQTTVFLNEIHYDNAGTDVYEGVEVAGPAGTDLTGWKVLFYNGNGGVVYDSVILTGYIPGQQNGFGTVWKDAPGSIQNGPDGIALIGASGEVMQFLSYEGIFTAGDGPASGMTSTDIGVAEGGETPSGQSIQLSGHGSLYADFSWTADQHATPGAVNEAQLFGTAVPGDTIPPCFTTGYPKAVNITGHRFDVLLKLSEVCTVYYLMRTGSEQAPDSLEVRRGDTLMVGHPDTEYSLHVDTASPSSVYELYFMAADHAAPPNVMDTVVSLQVRTMDDTHLRLVSPTARDTAFAGDSVTISWASADIDSIHITMLDFRGMDWTLVSGGGIPASDSSWGFYIPIDAGIDSMVLRIASTRDAGLYAESGVICLVDTIPPEVIGLSPPNHSTGIPLLPTLEMEFNEQVYPGTGSISIYGEYGGLIENMDVTGDQIEFDAADYAVRIMLSSSLPLSGQYHILIDPGAFLDYQDNAFPGFSSDDDWSFTTTPSTGSHLACLENPAIGRIRIYPNPAEEQITLEWYGSRPGDVAIEIIGIKGMTVYRNSYRSIVRLQENIGLQDLTAGLYMLRLQTGEGVSISWLVVK